MTPKHYTAVILLLLSFCNSISAQIQARQDVEKRFVPAQVMVQLETKNTPENIVRQLQTTQPDAGFYLKKVLAPSWHIYLLGFNESKISGETLLAFLRNTSGIREAQFDAYVQDRNTEPNDVFWNKQGDMELIGAPKAWDVTTGGVTAGGDTIVVGILEKGANREHPDLKPNLWVNWKEIPDNLIDDDQNGFVDDHLGYNAVFGGDGDGLLNAHSPGVSGIIGARGNNATGVSGVNWNVKLLNVVVEGQESDIVTGYNYLGELRRQYNESDGKRGAFIVASNASFGVDYGQPEDYPLWCAVYDSLGALGILNCAATIDHDVDVDQAGDVPTGCSSEYLIAVTAVLQTDERQPMGYGKVNVDLAAPGDGTWTTSVANTYGVIGKCSAAAPHVTGAVALLYSLDCDTFTYDAKSNPSACARRVREAMLQSVKHLPELETRTVTGGRLDLGAAVNLVVQRCGGNVLAPFSFQAMFPNPAHDWLRIEYQTPDYSPLPLRIYNVLGQLVLNRSIKPNPFEPFQVDLDLSDWKSGTYFVVFGADKGVTAKRFVRI